MQTIFKWRLTLIKHLLLLKFVQYLSRVLERKIGLSMIEERHKCLIYVFKATLTYLCVKISPQEELLRLKVKINKSMKQVKRNKPAVHWYHFQLLLTFERTNK